MKYALYVTYTMQPRYKTLDPFETESKIVQIYTPCTNTKLIKLNLN